MITTPTLRTKTGIIITKKTHTIKIIYLIDSKNRRVFFRISYPIGDLSELFYLYQLQISVPSFKMQIIHLRGVSFQEKPHNAQSSFTKSTAPCWASTNLRSTKEKLYEENFSQSLTGPDFPASLGANEKSMRRTCRHFPPPLNPQRASHSLTLT